MNCMNCGKPTIGNAILCRECAAQERRSAQPVRKSSAVIWLAAAACLFAAIAVSMAVYLFRSSNSRSAERARLRVEEEELQRREYQLTQSEGEATRLAGELTELQEENDHLHQQINELDSQLGSLDSEQNQTVSNYIQQTADLEQQLRQLQGEQENLTEALKTLQEKYETLEEDNTALQEDYDLLDEDYEDLQKELEDLQDRYDLLVAGYRGNSSSVDTSAYLTYKKKADFLDSYIVFVQDDGTNYYHSYDCPNFTSSTFWAYNRSLAKSQGFTACPRCGGGG